MFEILKKAKEDSLAINELSLDQKNLLISSILVECAKGDGEFTEIEVSQIKKILRTKLNLNEDNINEVLNQAIENSKERVEMYSLTKKIRDQFEKEQILTIFEYMWEVILSDGIIDDFEAALMSKATGLFHLTGRESAEAKKTAQNSIKKQD